MSATSNPEKIASILPKVEGVDRRGVSRDHSTVTPAQNLEFFLAQANQLRRHFEDHYNKFAIHCRREMELRDTGKEVYKAAVLRLKEQENPVTGRQHSGSSAEEYAATDPAYAAHLKELRDVVFDKNTEYRHAESAKLACKTAYSAMKAIGDWA